jgi:hypothetical protein
LIIAETSFSGAGIWVDGSSTLSPTGPPVGRAQPTFTSSPMVASWLIVKKAKILYELL